MKNFFKKLSFVMALAMVLTALAPAVAGADASYIYKRGNDTQKEAVEVWFGDADEKRDLNVKINGKKTTDGTWKIGNTKIATIDENGVVTPVKNGTTTAKFTAEDGTVAKVKVVVGTRAAGVKVKDNGVAVTELTLVAGETKELKFGAYISGKAKKAGATKASQAVSFTVEGEAVTATEKAGNKVDVKADKAGEATLTFTAGKKTATVKVTVVNGLAAAQTGAAKITVTGSNLTDKVADYVVKKGSVNVSIKSVTLNADATEAVLTASVNALAKGDYTVSFQGSDAVALTVEAAYVADINILSDVAILKGNEKNVVEVYYEILNQFGENVTKDAALAGAKISYTGSGKLVESDNKGTVTITNEANYTPNVSVVSLAIVCVTNGVNDTKTLTVSTSKALNSVEIKGIYKYNLKTETYEAASLYEGMTDKHLESYVLLVAGADQYGYVNTDSSMVYLTTAGYPGLVATTRAAITINRVPYMAYNLTTQYGKLNAGSVSALAVVTTSGKTSSLTIDVASVAKIDSISIGTTTVYAGQKNVLEYAVTDTDGNAVTKFDDLKALNGVAADGTPYLPANMSFVRNTDGTAKLVYNLEGEFESIIIATLNPVLFKTPTYVFNNVTFTVQPKCVPTAIVGLDADTVLGVVGVEGEKLEIKASNLIVQDQYGNVMSDDVFAASGYKVKVTPVLDLKNAFDGVDKEYTETVAKVADKSKVLATLTANAGNYGSASLTLTLVNEVKGEDKDVANSSTTVTVKSVAMNDLDNFAIVDTGLLVAEAAHPINVTAYAGSTLVSVPAGMYTVIGEYAAASNIVSAPAIVLAKEGYTTKKFTVNVVINNATGTLVSKELEYSNAPAKVVYAIANPFIKAENVRVDGTTVTAGVAKSFALAVTQYSNWTYCAGAMFGDATEARVTFSNLPVGATVNMNNTKAAELNLSKVAPAGEYTIHVLITYTSGATFEYDLVVNTNAK